MKGSDLDLEQVCIRLPRRLLSHAARLAESPDKQAVLPRRETRASILRLAVALGLTSIQKSREG